MAESLCVHTFQYKKFNPSNEIVANCIVFSSFNSKQSLPHVMATYTHVGSSTKRKAPGRVLWVSFYIKLTSAMQIKMFVWPSHNVVFMVRLMFFEIMLWSSCIFLSLGSVCAVTLLVQIDSGPCLKQSILVLVLLGKVFSSFVYSTKERCDVELQSSDIILNFL